MKKVLYIAILLTAGLVSFGCKAKLQGGDSDGMKLDVFDQLGGDFILTDQDGKKFGTKDLRGKIVLLFFGYTNCPDVCPLTLARYGAAYKLLGDGGNDVQSVFVSVDPRRDTPEKLKKYLGYYKFNPIGLTGTEEEVAKVSQMYKIIFVKRLTGNSSGYLFDHSTASFLIDKKGRVRHLFGQNDRPETISTVINVLKKEG